MTSEFFDSELAPRPDAAEALTALARKNPGARRRHGHPGPGAASRGARFPRRTFCRLRLPSQGQQRPADADPAAGDRGHPLRLRHGGGGHPRDQHLFLDPIAQADYGLQEVVYELNRDGARLARRAALKAERIDGKRRFVAGALGPTNRTASISPDVQNPGFRAVTLRRTCAKPTPNRSSACSTAAPTLF